MSLFSGKALAPTVTPVNKANMPPWQTQGLQLELAEAVHMIGIPLSLDLSSHSEWHVLADNDLMGHRGAQDQQKIRVLA